MLRYSQVRANVLIVVFRSVAHRFADVILKLLKDPVKGQLFIGKESGMGQMLAALCICRCKFASRTPCMGVRFVCDSQRICGTDDTEVNNRWVVSSSRLNNNVHWLSEDGSSTFRQKHWTLAVNAYSGVVPLFQAVGSVTKGLSPGQAMNSFFNWYPEPEHLSDVVIPRSFQHHISREHVDRNLDWNARVIIMDLLLLVDQDDMLLSTKHRLLQKLFPVQTSPENDAYSSIKAQSKSLWLFFSHFWQPTLNHFRRVFQERREDAVVEVAIGEVCHVLGITCRTQWMMNGFLCPLVEQFNDHSFVEYLPCRFDRLLSLLQQYSDACREFLKDLKDVYSLLRDRYLQKGNEVVFNPDLDRIINDDQKAQEVYFPSTKHFLLSDFFYADKRMCEDPREKNVYLFALLEFS